MFYSQIPFSLQSIRWPPLTTYHSPFRCSLPRDEFVPGINEPYVPRFVSVYFPVVM